MNIKFIRNLLICLMFWAATPVFGYVSTFEPRFTLSEEYNDNIYLAREDKTDDFITVVSPGFNYDIRGLRAGATVDYELGHSFYKDNSENDSFRHNAEIVSFHDLSRYTRFQVRDTLEKTEEPFTESSGDSGRRTRDSYLSNSAGAELRHRFGERRSITIDYYYNILNNDDDAVEDNSSHNSSLDLIYYFDPHLGLETEVDYTKGMYDISPGFDEWVIETRLVKEHSRFLSTHIGYSHTFMNYDPNRNQEYDYQVYHPFAGAGYSFDEDASVSLTVGYFIQDIEKSSNQVAPPDPDQPSPSNNSGLTIEALIGKAWTFRRGEISIETISGYEESYLNSDNLGFNIYNEINGRAAYSFSREIRIWGELSFRNDEYVDSPMNQPDRHDKRTTSGLGLDWQVVQWLEFNTEYRYNSLNSNESNNDYKENRVLLSVTLSKPYTGSRTE